ncbi:hypothetical protein ARMGADRAFT_1083896 [Armillaria gallica]|uniref:Uncharacterized protein n=1 Tax=Armillaria gallica TaxID=47427 RepID=A0A2H3D5K4_ARMGA|nr:hypothetical protein ARMGADRAFT_1083896 [Armillaria gallica]
MSRLSILICIFCHTFAMTLLLNSGRASPYILPVVYHLPELGSLCCGGDFLSSWVPGYAAHPCKIDLRRRTNSDIPLVCVNLLTSCPCSIKRCHRLPSVLINESLSDGNRNTTSHAESVYEVYMPPSALYRNCDSLVDLYGAQSDWIYQGSATGEPPDNSTTVSPASVLSRGITSTLSSDYPLSMRVARYWFSNASTTVEAGAIVRVL